MTEAQPRGEDAGPTERRAAADRLLEAHGAELRGYCRAMLDEQEAADVLLAVFGYVEEHGIEGPLAGPDARLTLLAVTHNRCIERSRTGGRPPRGAGRSADEAEAIRALAQLRPMGRGMVLLRAVLGLGWHELERVSGKPRRRVLQRVTGAWRRISALTGGERRDPDLDGGAPLDERPETWARIRA
ncbi:MAG: hypothetical protein KDK70_30695, partial [Myxococcales bacterium]|nr:hypothetical protein [Myxococcales bacterium]